MHGASTCLCLQSFSSPVVIGEAVTEHVSANSADKTGLAGMIEVQVDSWLLGVFTVLRAIGMSNI
jgi:hypothetical protein